MIIDESYFDYPHRSKGMDHDLYPLRYLRTAPKVDFGGDTKLAIWVTCDVDFFPLDMDNKPFRPAGGTWRPYPDLWTYSSRDYGNRYGVYRILETLTDLGVTPTMFVQGEAAERMPVLMNDLAEAGVEFAAGGWSMGDIQATPMEIETERALISKTKAALSPWANGPMGWRSPARSETRNTPDLLAEAGFHWLADWANDDMPYKFNNGLKAMPLSYDAADTYVVFEQNQTAAQWCKQIEDAATFLLNEAETYGGRVLNISLSSWVTGQPYRIAFLHDLIERLLAKPGTAPMTASAILEATDKTLTA